MPDAYQCDEEPHITTLRREIAKEQVTRPLGEYTPERVERLVAQMDFAQKWTQPKDLMFNF